jgi:hypothetical protein
MLVIEKIRAIISEEIKKKKKKRKMPAYNKQRTYHYKAKQTPTSLDQLAKPSNYPIER